MDLQTLKEIAEKKDYAKFCKYWEEVYNAHKDVDWKKRFEETKKLIIAYLKEKKQNLDIKKYPLLINLIDNNSKEKVLEIIRLLNDSTKIYKKLMSKENGIDSFFNWIGDITKNLENRLKQ